MRGKCVGDRGMGRCDVGRVWCGEGVMWGGRGVVWEGGVFVGVEGRSVVSKA